MSAPPRWLASLGVAPSVTPLNLVSFLLHSMSSILFLVFLNSSQPFLIAQLGETKRQGSLSGTLVFSDELFSIFLVLLWGSLADVVGTRPVAVAGYIFISTGLASFTLAAKPWPDLLWTRLVFAMGGSAVTAMLTGEFTSCPVKRFHSSHEAANYTTGILNSYSATAREERTIQHRERAEVEEATEETTLLRESSRAPIKASHGRLAAMAGLSTGVGALFAVFFLLRLPTWLASIHDRKSDEPDPSDGHDEGVRKGTREAYWIVSFLALVVAVLLAFGLKMDRPEERDRQLHTEARAVAAAEEDAAQVAAINSATGREARRLRMKRRQAKRSARANTIKLKVVRLSRGMIDGFTLVRQDKQLALAYLGGALARACTIATTVFVPLLVTRFYYNSGRCATLPTPDLPPSELKKACREAFTTASILSGVIQLLALILAPLAGQLCDSISPAFSLLLGSSAGTAGFLTIALGPPNDGDPRSTTAFVAAAGIGLCQISAIVASLALCAQAKSRLSTAKPHHHFSTENEEASDERQSAGVVRSGAIAGAYSFTGGVSILLVSSLGGFLSDLRAGAPFFLFGGLSALTLLASLLALLLQRN